MIEAAVPEDIGLVRRGYSETGGAEAYLLRLASGLHARGYRTTLYASKEWPEGRWPFGKLVRLEATQPFEFARAFRRARKPEQLVLSLDRVPGCDVFRAGDGVHAAWLQRRSHFESFWRRQLRFLNLKHAALLALERELFKTVSAVIVNSRMVAEEVIHWHGFPTEKIHVIPNGIGPGIPRFSRQEARERLEIPEPAYCILFIGTGWERKGLRFAIEAAESLGPSTILLVAGRGQESRYRSPCARFLGAVKDLAVLFSASDVFTLPTIYDPFSNACLEAAAAGLPVITTTANGFSEILTPGVHGEVVEPGNVTALAQALEAWRGRNTAATSETCRRLAECYSIERNVEATLDVLKRLKPGRTAPLSSGSDPTD
jgi:UDP-glucose:(heptosyl)LPS alpha-1,3-glucosyltransferase